MNDLTLPFKPQSDSYAQLAPQDKALVDAHIGILRMIDAPGYIGASKMNDAIEASSTPEGLQVLSQRRGMDQYIDEFQRLRKIKLTPSIRSGNTREEALVNTHIFNLRQIRFPGTSEDFIVEEMTKGASSQSGIAVLKQLKAIDEYFEMKEKLHALKSARRSGPQK